MDKKCSWNTIISAISYIVFLFLDLVDSVLCIFYKFLDEFIEGSSSKCYCHYNVSSSSSVDDDEIEVSASLYERKNIFRRSDIFGSKNSSSEEYEKKKVEFSGNRWSDCGCESCSSWQKNGDQRLYTVVKDHSQVPGDNVIFIHGFLSSSSIWTETVFPNLSESIQQNYRFFAIDLLGFGRSPKPRNCSYTLKDHLDMIEKSVILPFHLSSFHLVAHSMGCIIALALVAKYPNSVKSITLIAPPYFDSSEDNASLTALKSLAVKKLWPPLLFGSSVMSWYEHLGRCICFIICRNHRTWEWILKLLTRKRDLPFTIFDITKHTHHSAWHTMHNVVCGGSKFMNEFLQISKSYDLKLNVIQGDKDQVVPLECSSNIKLKVPLAEVKIIENADHSGVILGRAKSFTCDLERTWESSARIR